MQLCKCLNCFLKTYNKQLNQYCLNFINFFLPKKKSFKKNSLGSGRVTGRVGLTRKKHGLGHGSTHFLLWVKKIGFESSIFWVRSGQKILTCFAMSNFATSFGQNGQMPILAYIYVYIHTQVSIYYI